MSNLGSHVAEVGRNRRSFLFNLKNVCSLKGWFFAVLLFKFQILAHFQLLGLQKIFFSWQFLFIFKPTLLYPAFGIKGFALLRIWDLEGWDNTGIPLDLHSCRSY
eukprot:EG_transcript_42872